MCLKCTECVLNSVDPDQIRRSAASDLGLYTVCLCLSDRILKINSVGSLEKTDVYIFFIRKS